MEQDGPDGLVGFDFEFSLIKAPLNKNGKKLDVLGRVARRIISREVLGLAFEKGFINEKVFKVSMESIGKEPDSNL
jgi:hypothetical protein